MQRQPTFYVRDIPIFGDTILSPMAGYSDVPYRAVCRSFGAAMSYTEFVAVEMLQTSRPNPFWRLLDYRPDDRPMVFQIFGHDARMILNAALRIEQWGPDIIDINMGCSTQKVSSRGAGVGMMRNPRLVAETFALLTRHLAVPVTAKIRLGWEEDQNYLEIAHILADNGCALIAIHPRTKEQKYGGQADWDAIAALKDAVDLPVIGNGDIERPQNIDAMLEQTGCDAVMIGRNAIGNPWLFARRHKDDISVDEVVATVRRHLEDMLSYHDVNGLQRFRKHLKGYFGDLPVLRPILAQATGAEQPQTVFNLLEEITGIAAAAGAFSLGELRSLESDDNDYRESLPEEAIFC
jgi:nifR3 family TIM-barrel protein